MSDALNYLVATRPDAMGAYFKFLKKAGDHLDTRTRDLISVITKVAVQTEPGFKQYLTRALRNGASPNEIIDALLMAFPVLGLAKIVWATDILLAMDIPEFRPENLDAAAQWHDIAALADLPDGEISFMPAEGRHLFVYRKARPAQGLRLPLPAPGHRHPPPGPGGHPAHLPQAPLGLRRGERGLRGDRQQAPAPVRAQGRGRAGAGLLVGPDPAHAGPCTAGSCGNWRLRPGPLSSREPARAQRRLSGPRTEAHPSQVLSAWDARRRPLR